MSTPRLRWMIQTVADSLVLSEKVVEIIDNFLKGKEPEFLYICSSNQNLSIRTLDVASYDALFGTNCKNKNLQDKAVYFYRTLPEGKVVDTEQPYNHEVLFAEISLKSTTHAESNEPLVQSLLNRGECEEELQNEFLIATKKCTDESDETLISITTFDDIAYKETEANEQARLAFLQKNFARWLDEIEKQFQIVNEPERYMYNAGPRTELIYWQEKLQMVTNLSKELKGTDFKAAQKELEKEKINEHIQKLTEQCTLIDIAITDKLSEARENVKYLITLDKFIEPLYTGKPQEIIDTLPAFMSAIYTMTEYYNTNEKMTNLFVKVTNQMINNCKARIQEDSKNIDKIWDKNPEFLLNELEDCLRLNYTYQKEYNTVKTKINNVEKARKFDLSNPTIFGKFDLFCRRVKKLIDIFSTIQQFSVLKKQGFEGIEDIAEKFDVLISTYREKRYDLLDYQNNKFDRHFVQFNVDKASLLEKINEDLERYYCIKLP